MFYTSGSVNEELPLQITAAAKRNIWIMLPYPEKLHGCSDHVIKSLY